jgi:hypothetical protein
VGRKQSYPAASRGRSRASGRSRLPLFLLTALCSLLTACRPNKRYDLIEAELRTRERELVETRAALDQAKALNRAYDSRRGAGVLPGAHGPTVPSGPPAAIPVRDVQLARGTGGMDEDGVPGDEALMLVVVPRDEDGSAVKVPARLSVAAWQVSREGIKTPIGAWDVPADKLRPLWRSGLISTGYFVSLGWQTFPTAERVRVAIRLTTTDGRAFEADRDITVRPVGGPRPSREPLLPSHPPPGVPFELPPPAEVPPPPGNGVQLGRPVKP